MNGVTVDFLGSQWRVRDQWWRSETGGREDSFARNSQAPWERGDGKIQWTQLLTGTSFSLAMVDVIFADVAQPDQTRIVALNAHTFLRNGGHFVISIKVRGLGESKMGCSYLLYH